MHNYKVASSFGVQAFERTCKPHYNSYYSKSNKSASLFRKNLAI